MAARAEPDRLDTTPIDLLVRARPALERIPALLDDAGAWLGGQPLESEASSRRFLCDLRLRTGPTARARFRKSAVVAFGSPICEPDGLWVPVEWRSANFTPLFPVFAGYLEVRVDHLAIHGRYAPPGGTIGRAVDAAVLHIVALATARWFLGRLAAALEQPPAIIPAV